MRKKENALHFIVHSRVKMVWWPELCIGCTQCAGLCPAVFRMEGVLAVAEPGPIPPL